MSVNTNTPIEIALGSGYIPLRIGGIDFKFSTSDDQQAKYYEKYDELTASQEKMKELQKSMDEMETLDTEEGNLTNEQKEFINKFETATDDVMDLIKETIDCALGKDAFNLLYEKAGGDSTAVFEAFLLAMDAIKNAQQKKKLNKYIQNKKK